MYSLFLCLTISFVTILFIFDLKKNDSLQQFVLIFLLIAGFLWVGFQTIGLEVCPVTHKLGYEVEIIPVGNTYIDFGNGTMKVLTTDGSLPISGNVKIIKTKGKPIVRKYETTYVNKNMNKWLLIPQWGWTEIYVN